MDAPRYKSIPGKERLVIRPEVQYGAWCIAVFLIGLYIDGWG